MLTMDGVGEWATASVAEGSGHNLTMTREIHWPHSLGLLYSAFTYYTGFKVNSGEYKVMGLAPYGEPTYKDLILDNLIDLKEDGSFRLNLDYFDYCIGMRMTNHRFDALFDGPARNPEELLTTKHMDLAASVQAVTEEVMLRLTRALAKDNCKGNLCLAGGVALNCVANGKVLRDGAFKNIWVQPAAGDAGGALGAALIAYHGFLGEPRKSNGTLDAMSGSYLGPEYSQAEIETRLEVEDAKFETMDETTLISRVANALADGKAVGWFQAAWSSAPGRSATAHSSATLVHRVCKSHSISKSNTVRVFVPLHRPS